MAKRKAVKPAKPQPGPKRRSLRVAQLNEEAERARLGAKKGGALKHALDSGIPEEEEEAGFDMDPDDFEAFEEDEEEAPVEEEKKEEEKEEEEEDEEEKKEEPLPPAHRVTNEANEAIIRATMRRFKARLRPPAAADAAAEAEAERNVDVVAGYQDAFEHQADIRIDDVAGNADEADPGVRIEGSKPLDIISLNSMEAVSSVGPLARLKTIYDSTQKALDEGHITIKVVGEDYSRRPFSDPSNIFIKSDYQWRMTFGEDTAKRRARVAKLLTKLERFRHVIRQESWGIAVRRDTDDKDMADIHNMPLIWQTYSGGGSLLDVPPPVIVAVDQVGDLDPDSRYSRERAREAALVRDLGTVRINRGMPRLPSKTLETIMLEFLKEAQLDQPGFDLVPQTNDTNMLYKFIVFHLDGFHGEDDDINDFDTFAYTYSTITRMRNFLLYTVYNPYKSTINQYLKAIKVRVVQYYMQPGTDKFDPKAITRPEVLVWKTFLVRTPAAKRAQDVILNSTVQLKAKEFAYKVEFTTVFAQVKALITPTTKKPLLDLYNLVIWVMCVSGLRLNEVFRPFIELRPVVSGSGRIKEPERWVLQIGTSKQKELRTLKWTGSEPDGITLKRSREKPLAFGANFKRLEQVLQIIRQYAAENLAKRFPDREYASYTALELTAFFGQNVNRRMQKAFQDQADHARAKGIPFGSHWNRALYANVAFDQFSDSLDHISKPGFIADVLLHDPGNMNTAARYSNILVGWGLARKYDPAVANTLEQLKVFADWASDRIERLGQDVSVVRLGMPEPEEIAPPGQVILSSNNGTRVMLTKLKHVRTSDPEDRIAFVVGAVELLTDHNVPLTTSNFVRLGVSAGFVTMWRKKMKEDNAEEEEQKEEEEAKVDWERVETAENRDFLRFAIKFATSEYVFMKPAWLWSFVKRPMVALRIEDFAEMKGPASSLTQTELLDVTRPPTELERFYYSVYLFMKGQTHHAKSMNSLFETEGASWSTTKMGNVIQENAKELAIPIKSIGAFDGPAVAYLTMTKLETEAWWNDNVPEIYQYLYQFSDNPPLDLLSGAARIDKMDAGSNRDITPDMIQAILSHPTVSEQAFIDGLDEALKLSELTDVAAMSLLDKRRLTGREGGIRDMLETRRLSSTVNMRHLLQRKRDSGEIGESGDAPAPRPSKTADTAADIAARETVTEWTRRMELKHVVIISSGKTNLERLTRYNMALMTEKECHAYKKRYINTEEYRGMVPLRIKQTFKNGSAKFTLHFCVDVPYGEVADVMKRIKDEDKYYADAKLKAEVVFDHVDYGKRFPAAATPDTDKEWKGKELKDHSKDRHKK